MLEAVVLVKPGHGFQVAVFTRRLRSAGGRLVGGTRLEMGLGRAGEPLDAIGRSRSLVPAGAGSRHFRLARWRGLYPFSLGQGIAVMAGISRARRRARYHNRDNHFQRFHLVLSLYLIAPL